MWKIQTYKTNELKGNSFTEQFTLAIFCVELFLVDLKHLKTESCKAKTNSNKVFLYKAKCP